MRGDGSGSGILYPTKCTSRWGHKWIEQGNMILDPPQVILCVRCCLVQKLDNFMFPDGMWMDEGYLSLKDVLSQVTHETRSKEETQ